MMRELDGEAFSAFFAARRQDATAVLRAHALHEAVNALAPAVMWLESAFHVYSALGSDATEDRQL